MAIVTRLSLLAGGPSGPLFEDFTPHVRIYRRVRAAYFS